MAGKTSKQKKQARKKLVDDQGAYHVDPLVKLIRYPYRPETHISNSCIRKMWKTSPRHCSRTLVRPWLVLPPDDDSDPQTNDILCGEWSQYWWRHHENPWSPCSCCSKGTQQSSELTWTKEESSLVDPNSPLHEEPLTAQFTNAIIFRNKVYALSLQGTLATVDLDSHPRLQVLNVGRAVPSTVSRGFREYLVECGGELMVVFLISRKSMNVVDEVEVYRLDDVSWIKVVSLGDTVLFASHSRCAGISASESGCRRNCVYFTQAKEGGWWVFDMEDGRISPSWTRGSPHTTPPTLITSTQ